MWRNRVRRTFNREYIDGFYRHATDGNGEIELPFQKVLMRLSWRAESIGEFDISYTWNNGDFASHTEGVGELDVIALLQATLWRKF